MINAYFSKIESLYPRQLPDKVGRIIYFKQQKRYLGLF